MANLFFIVAHILAVMFGFVWLILTVPFHLFYLNGKKNSKELKKQTDILQKQKKEERANSAVEEANKIEKEKLAQNSTADEILKLSKLKDDGIISEEEFEAKKKKLLDL